MDATEHTSPENPFEDCSAERVFNGLRAGIQTPDVRTLWLRLDSELADHGVGGASTYLGAEFTRLKEALLAELSAIKSR